MASCESQNSRLVLGTAQLGMRYGLTNKAGRPGTLESESIVAKVWQCGIREFDTAQAYGDSELVLGRILNSLGLTHKAKIISKFHPEIDHRSSSCLRRALEQTLTRLGQDKLYGMMLHGEDFLEHWDTGLGKTLNEFVEKNLVERIGISVYKPQSAIRALRSKGITLVQIPSNLLDRRFEEAGVLHEAEDCGKQIYVRSVFLQGLLLLNPGDLPQSMQFAIPVIERLVSLSKKTGLSQKQMALGYVKASYPGQKVVFGCETAQQADENIKIWKMELPGSVIEQIKSEFRNIPEKILNPSYWT